MTTEIGSSEFTEGLNHPSSPTGGIHIDILPDPQNNSVPMSRPDTDNDDVDEF